MQFGVFIVAAFLFSGASGVPAPRKSRPIKNSSLGSYNDTHSGPHIEPLTVIPEAVNDQWFTQWEIRDVVTTDDSVPGGIPNTAVESLEGLVTMVPETDSEADGLSHRSPTHSEDESPNTSPLIHASLASMTKDLQRSSTTTSESHAPHKTEVGAPTSLKKRGEQSPETSRYSERDIQFIADQKQRHKQFKRVEKQRKKQFQREEKQRKKQFHRAEKQRETAFDKWNKHRYYNEWEKKVGLRNNSLVTARGYLYDAVLKKRMPFRLTKFFYDMDRAKMSVADWRIKWKTTIARLDSAQGHADSLQKHEEDEEQEDWFRWFIRQNKQSKLARRGEHATSDLLCAKVPDPRVGRKNKKQRLCGQFTTDGALELSPIVDPNNPVPLAEVCVNVVDHRSQIKRFCGRYRDGKLRLLPKAGRDAAAYYRHDNFFRQAQRAHRKFKANLKKARKQLAAQRKLKQLGPQKHKELLRELAKDHKDFHDRQFEEKRKFHLYHIRKFRNDIEEKLGLRNNSLTTGGGFNAKGKKRFRGFKRRLFLLEGLSGIMSKKRWMKKWAKTIELLNTAQDVVDLARKASDVATSKDRSKDRTPDLCHCGCDDVPQNANNTETSRDEPRNVNNTELSTNETLCKRQVKDASVSNTPATALPLELPQHDNSTTPDNRSPRNGVTDSATKDPVAEPADVAFPTAALVEDEQHASLGDFNITEALFRGTLAYLVDGDDDDDDDGYEMSSIVKEYIERKFATQLAENRPLSSLFALVFGVPPTQPTAAQPRMPETD